MSTRTYADAIDSLNSLQSNAATLEASRASGGKLVKTAIPETIEYLSRIGYTPEDLNALNVIHVTGTKGKGSTCAFTDSILRHVRPDWKVGLYTSPHLIAVRERIRINGIPLPEDQFARFFFEVWDRLGQNDKRANHDTLLRPMYFRFLTLVAYHAFLQLKVNATILEVGVGGTHDCTNIVPSPIITGISALGIDHVTVLGKTIKEIAWQKGGIYKPGVPALAVNQPDEGLEVLKQRAEEKLASEFIVVPLTPGLLKAKLGLPGSHQYQNASLAINLARIFLHKKADTDTPSPSLSTSSSPSSSSDELPSIYIEALRNTKWPGRCQTVVDPRRPQTVTWFLDGAHTAESLDCCVQWFVDPETALRTPVNSRPQRILIFNCTSGRSGGSFLGSILAKTATQLKLHSRDEDSNTFFDHVIFCTNVTYADGNFKGDLTAHALSPTDLAQLKTQNDLAAAWQALNPAFPKDHIRVLPSIEHATRVVEEQAKVVGGTGKVDVLVTGSLHLVGGMIEVAGLSEVAL